MTKSSFVVTDPVVLIEDCFLPCVICMSFQDQKFNITI